MNTATRIPRAFTSLCLTLVMMMTVVAVPRASADEMYGKYQIYSSNIEDMLFYSVYTPEQQRQYSTTYLHSAFAPTFITSAEDVYTNYLSGNDKRITFYTGVEVNTREHAEAFASYVASKSNYRHRYAAWFSLDYYNSSIVTTRYCVYLIEGWDETMPVTDLTLDLFFSDYGIQLWFYEVGHGDQIRDKWDYIRDTMCCSLAVWFRVQQPRDGITVGMQFTNHDGDWLPNYV